MQEHCRQTRHFLSAVPDAPQSCEALSISPVKPSHLPNNPSGAVHPIHVGMFRFLYGTEHTNGLAVRNLDLMARKKLAATSELFKSHSYTRRGHVLKA